MKYKIVQIFIALLTIAACGQYKRGRNDGTLNITASNVSGNGNITCCGLLTGGYGSSGFYGGPQFGLKVGIGHILQLSGSMAIENFTRLGIAEGHLQITTPGNDRLRFCGVAISGDLYLSTEIDTLSGTTTSGRPEYNAYIRPSFIADIDWMAKFKNIPCKTYLFFGFVDDPDILFRYSQLAVKLGIELKLERNSYCIDIGSGFYKEKKNNSNKSAADKSFAQQLLWIEPSIRYRIFKRNSFLGGMRIFLFQRVKRLNPLKTDYFRISTAVEIPLVYKETNSEAIRTMLFIEREKMNKEDTLERSIDVTKGDVDSLKINIDGLNLDIIEIESEENVLKRREEIQKKMDEIEQILEEIE